MPEEANTFFCRIFDSSSPSPRQIFGMAVHCTVPGTEREERLS